MAAATASKDRVMLAIASLAFSSDRHAAQNAAEISNKCARHDAFFSLCLCLRLTMYGENHRVNGLGTYINNLAQCAAIRRARCCSDVADQTIKALER